MIQFTRQSQTLVPNESGYLAWVCRRERASIDPRRLAVVVCDMWDRTWSRAANERCEPLAREIDRFLTVARQADVTIIHAPSGTIGPYEGTPARLRVLGIPQLPLPEKRAHEDPVLPVDDSDGGSDTNLGDEKVHTTVQTRQTALIAIDQVRDFISDSGQEIYSLMRARGIETVLLCGVHTNMCVMNRTFGIKSFVSRGIPILLVRDLTDSLYNPGRSPYVSHDEGTALMVGYIEKFWCPTVTSAEIIADLPG
jgi:hypothetical protein